MRFCKPLVGGLARPDNFSWSGLTFWPAAELDSRMVTVRYRRKGRWLQRLSARCKAAQN
jgi:hypothetical protein